jgi:hypothetical protein
LNPGNAQIQLMRDGQSGTIYATAQCSGFAVGNRVTALKNGIIFSRQGVSADRRVTQLVDDGQSMPLAIKP